MRSRVGLLASAAAVLALALPLTAQAATVTNVFSGNWATTVAGGKGSVAFRVLSDSDGASLIQSLGGSPCGAPTTFYRGDYSDPANPHGVIAGCIATAGHMLGRFRSDSGGSGDVDITLTQPGEFSGFFTYLGDRYNYSGTFLSHFPDDGCCPAPASGGSPGGGGTGAGDCGASAARAGLSVTRRPGACPPRQPAVSRAEKDAASDKANRNLALMVVFCLFADPDEHSDICAFVIDMASYVGQIQNDPASNSFARVHLAPARAARVSSLSLFCPRGCPGAAGAEKAFVAALSRLEAALAGLAIAGNRYSGAKLAGSAAGIQLQAGIGQAYSGVVADAITSLTVRATALSNALTRAGVTTAVTSTQIERIVTTLQTSGLPAAYARRLPAGGEDAPTLARQITDGVGPSPPPASFSQILPPSLPSAPFRAANRTISVAEVSALVDQLQSQRSISKRARALLHTDLVAVTRARNAGARAAGLARLRRDVGRLGRGVRPATATLLQHAVAGLSALR